MVHFLMETIKNGVIRAGGKQDGEDVRKRDMSETIVVLKGEKRIMGIVMED